MNTTTKATHTQGPLSYDPNGRSIFDEHGQTIAKVFCVLPLEDQPKPAREIHEEEQRANQRLFAAAPELLEALHALANTADNADDDFAEYRMALRASVRQARAAIAKATT